MLLIGPDSVDVPQLGEFQRAGAVAVGFFDLHDDPLEMFRIVVGVVADLSPQAKALAIS